MAILLSLCPDSRILERTRSGGLVSKRGTRQCSPAYQRWGSHGPLNPDSDMYTHRQLVIHHIRLLSRIPLSSGCVSIHRLGSFRRRCSSVPSIPAVSCGLPVGHKVGRWISSLHASGDTCTEVGHIAPLTSLGTQGSYVIVMYMRDMQRWGGHACCLRRCGIDKLKR